MTASTSAQKGLDKTEFGEVVKILKARYMSGARPEHVAGSDPFKVLVGALLSHRTRDEMTDMAYNKLFSQFKDPPQLANADVREIAQTIKAVGFYRQKAKRIKRIAQIIYWERSGKVPEDREELMKLPGVGPKTADIVLSACFGKPEVAVDTHVKTVAVRLGIASEKSGYEEIKSNVTKLAPADDLFLINQLFVRFGREICRRPKPKCNVCPITAYCRFYQTGFKA
ncbi:MAG: endonuclease III [Candidatus Caldarchaeum sp.]